MQSESVVGKPVEDPFWRDRFLKVAKQFLGKSRSGVHVTHLIFPRRTYFRTKHPEIGLTDDEIARFYSGHHHAFEILATLPEYREVEVNWNGIRGT